MIVQQLIKVACRLAQLSPVLHAVQARAKLIMSSPRPAGHNADKKQRHQRHFHFDLHFPFDLFNHSELLERPKGHREKASGLLAQRRNAQLADS